MRAEVGALSAAGLVDLAENRDDPLRVEIESSRHRQRRAARTRIVEQCVERGSPPTCLIQSPNDRVHQAPDFIFAVSIQQFVVKRVGEPRREREGVNERRDLRLPGCGIGVGNLRLDRRDSLFFEAIECLNILIPRWIARPCANRSGTASVERPSSNHSSSCSANLAIASSTSIAESSILATLTSGICKSRTEATALIPSLAASFSCSQRSKVQYAEKCALLAFCCSSISRRIGMTRSGINFIR